MQCIQSTVWTRGTHTAEPAEPRCWLEYIDTYSASSWRYLSEVSWPSWTGRVPLSLPMCRRSSSATSCVVLLHLCRWERAGQTCARALYRLAWRRRGYLTNSLLQQSIEGSGHCHPTSYPTNRPFTSFVQSFPFSALCTAARTPLQSRVGVGASARCALAGAANGDAAATTAGLPDAAASSTTSISTRGATGTTGRPPNLRFTQGDARGGLKILMRSAPAGPKICTGAAARP